MSYIQLKQKINNGQVKPVYLLYGTESFLIEDTVQTIINSVLNEEEKGMNLTIYDMKETPVEQAIEEAESYSFMGSARVVVIKDAYFLTANKDSSKLEHELKRLESYVQHPFKETVLVIVAPYEKLDERKKVVKQLKKECEVLHAVEFDEKLMREWLDAQALHYQVTVTDDARELMLQLLGGKLALIAQEMEKIVLYVGEAGTINGEVVTRLITRTVEQDVFSLIDHVVHGRLNAALRIFYDLMKQNEEPIKVLALLVRQFRILYQVKELSRRGYSQKQIASQIKVHPYVVKLAVKQVTRFTDAELLAILGKLADADYKIKSGKMDRQLVLELLITSFSSSKGNKPKLKTTQY